MNKSFFFYGYIDGEDNPDEVWKTLHDHFEKLAHQDDERSEESFTGKAAKRR